MTPKPASHPEVLGELALALLHLQGAMAEKIQELTAPYGQTPARWKVMAAAAGDPRTVPQIARRMGLTRQAVQRLANELVADGLARFAPNPDHKLSPYLLLTRRGRKLEEKITGGYHRWCHRFVSGTDGRRLKAATRTLRDLTERLEAERPGKGTKRHA